MEEIINKRRKSILDLIEEKEYSPMKINELAYFMEVPSGEKHLFEEMLHEMEKDGEILISKRGKIMPLSSMQVFKGVYQGHAKGFGFVMLDDPLAEDIFIPADYCNGAVHKDTVLCRIVAKEGKNYRAEGEIIKVLKRGMTSIVGTFIRSNNFGFVRPDETKIADDIYIPKKYAKGAVNGHKVVVKIVKPSSDNGKNHEGRIVEILGHINDPGVDILSIVRQFDLNDKFSEEVMAEAEKAQEAVSEADFNGRLDLTDVLTVTIDGEDAKDLDDAITLHKEGEIYKLGVHIADVSHYVKEGSELDKEALRRGTSVYLADRVIPMLPHKLSNGICSLNAGENRLALSCLMDIDKNGNVISHSIHETVLNVHQRLSYEGVSAALEGDAVYSKEYEAVLPMLREMGELAEILLNRRMERGSIFFNFQESKITLDEEGRPIDISPRARNFATSIIEEFMLISNETIAEEFYWLQLPFVYRSHAKPDKEKLLSLSEFLSNFGYRIKGKADHPKNIQSLLSKFDGEDEMMIISKAVLRSLKQARYTYENEGHFGLAANYYCHFTSPIRRYPDLQIHRIIKEYITGKLEEKRQKHYNKILPEVCKISSKTEREAEEAERETLNLKKAQYMVDKVGETYEGIISGITNWGIYVELPNTVEGMVSLSDMADDYYIFDQKNYEVVGKDGGKIYKLGQSVNIQVLRADIENRRVDFLMLNDTE